MVRTSQAGTEIKSKASVFHSFRHGFKDAARAARVSEDLHDALTGHAGSSVGRAYGAKDMVRRFGLEKLADAVNRIKYPGLDLSLTLANFDWAHQDRETLKIGSFSTIS